MNTHKIKIILLIIISIHINIFAKEELAINFKDLTITSFIHITSKALGKNIVSSNKIVGNVDFVNYQKIYKEDLLKILKHVLDSKGYSVIEEETIIKIVKQKNKNIILEQTNTKNIVKIIRLKNTEASTVLKVLNKMNNDKVYNIKKNKPSIAMDEDSNSIILMGIKNKLDLFLELISQLDEDKNQIFVQARIVEISENLTKNVGIKYGLKGFSSSGSVLSTFSSSLNNGSSIDSDLLSNFGLNLSTIKDTLTLGMSLNLLNQNGAVDIISEPSLLCINNKESSIYVGETITIKTGTTTTSSGIPTDTYTREDIGLTLKVKPRISNNDKVLLKIHTKLENVEQISTLSSNPNTSKKELITSAIVNNGESIILGGYIRSQKETINNKVPILGTLFKNQEELKDKINLVIIITPYIVPKEKDISYIRGELSKLKALEEKYIKKTLLRLSGFKKDEKKYHKTNKYAHEERVKEILGL